MTKHAELRRLFDQLKASQKDRGVDVVNRTRPPMKVAEPEGTGYARKLAEPDSQRYA
jgi:hypothetical protein